MLNPILIRIFIFLALLLSGVSSHSQELKNWQNCEVYLQIEDEYSDLNCKNSQHEYLISFGYHYCLKSRQRALHFENKLVKRFKTSFGARDLTRYKSWIWSTMQCLQEDLASYVDSTKQISCQGIKSFALSNHEKCYRESGFCSIQPYWHDIVFKIIGIKDFLTIISKNSDLLRICR